MLRNEILKVSLVVSFILSSQLVNAQSPDSASSSFSTGLTILVIIFLFAVIITIANRLMKLTAEKVGADKVGASNTVIPTWKEFFGGDTPTRSAEEGQFHVLRQGYDVPLVGDAEQRIDANLQATTFAMKPIDIHGMSPIPKLTVKEGASVKAGDVLFFDKKKPEVQYVAPVSGKLLAVNRGPKRRIDEVVISADKEMQYKAFTAPSLDASQEEIKNFLLESGGWSLLRQRPYNVAADPSETPRDIFISTFDTAPLAPDLSFAIQGREAAFQKGLDVLATLTSGHVYLGLDGRGETPISTAFSEATGVVKNYFKGKHPAGVVGVQIHHTAPIGKDDIVWTIDAQSVATIGTLFLEGKYDATKVVAVTGAELKEAKYVKTYQGASIESFVNNNTTNDHVRYVSGNVLTGTKIESKGFLGLYDSQVTVLAEGDYYEMFGWLVPVKARPSISNTFPHFLYPDKMTADTNTHGEKRAFVVTGQYEKVTPMDIYPQHLLKSILVNDFERMEGLGIYEVVEEDLALCEFVCTSKQDVQAILRQGIDMMIEQG
ncbi:MAG: Na(+)-translocating NADH-quinone reductase subunit A [Saprospiraceae bacterium]